MNKDQILHDDATNWDALMELIKTIPEEQVLEPNAIADWSLKDVLGHVFTWDEEVAKEVRQLVETGVPVDRPDDFNDVRAVELRSLSLAEVMERLDQAHTEVMDYLATLPESAFEIKGVTERSHGCMSHHYEEHLEDIQKWLVERTAEPASTAHL